MDEHRQDNQLEPINNSSVPVQDVAMKTSQEQWMIEMGGKRGSERSVLAVRHDDDDVIKNNMYDGQLVDQDVPMQCDQKMRFILQHILTCCLHNALIIVAMLQSHWSKKSSTINLMSSYELFSLIVVQKFVNSLFRIRQFYSWLQSFKAVEFDNKYILIISSLNWLIDLVGRVFANGSGDLGSIPGHVIPKTLKMVLDTSLLNTQQYKVCIKGKVEQSKERSSALP